MFPRLLRIDAPCEVFLMRGGSHKDCVMEGICWQVFTLSVWSDRGRRRLWGRLRRSRLTGEAFIEFIGVLQVVGVEGV